MTRDQIIEREFRKLPQFAEAMIEVTFNSDDETISVWADGDTYVFQAGSDDDEFCFECDNALPVRFAIPDDWE